MAGITKWGLCPAPGRPGRIASQEVDSAYCGSRCQQLTVSEHLAVACSLTCTRYKAALRRRFAQAHGTSSGSGPRPRRRCAFSGPKREAILRASARLAITGGGERSQVERNDHRQRGAIRGQAYQSGRLPRPQQPSCFTLMRRGSQAQVPSHSLVGSPCTARPPSHSLVASPSRHAGRAKAQSSTHLA